MAGLQFIHALMLAGLTALAIPVLIHLLLRQRQKRLRFSTIQFFRKQDEAASRRRKLRNWLLLAIRLLILILLVMAFARPFLPSIPAGGADRKQRHAIIVLDRSASMQAADTGGARWARAKDAVRRVLTELAADDRAAVISCAAQVDVLCPLSPPAVVAKRVGDLPPTCGPANLGEGLQQACRLAVGRDPAVATIIYVVTDLQRNSCQNLASYPIPLETEIQLLNTGDRFTPNLAVTDLQTEPNDGAKPHAVVTSYADEDRAEVRVQFSIDGKRMAALPIPLGAGASTNVDLALPALKPGWHQAEVLIEGQDAFPLDDRRYQTFFTPQPIRALVVETRASCRSFEEASFFITTALDPARDSTNSLPRPFVFDRSSPEDLAGKLAVRPGQESIDLVLLPACNSVPAGMGKALLDFVQAGGGLVFFLGDGMSINRYESEFGGLLPAQLSGLETSPDWESAWRIGDYATNTAVFAVFALPNSGNLALPRFTKRFTMAPIDTPNVIARFQDGTPLVVARVVGRGRVMLVNTTANTDWNDWPKHKTFVPWLHGLGHYATGRASRESSGTNISLAAGNDFVLEIGLAETQFGLQLPEGKTTPLRTDKQGRLSNAALTVPGIYTLRDGAGREVRRVAVNLPVTESDLAALPPAEFQSRLTRVAEPSKQALTADFFGSAPNRKELWRALLLAVLVLLFIETLVANRNLG